MYLIYIPVYYNVEVKIKYSITPLTRIIWDGDQTGYSENTDNWFFIETRLHWQFEVLMLLFTVCTCVYTFRPRVI
jgi:hypothetical protein